MEKTITMTQDELADLMRSVILTTLHELGVKPQKQLGWMARHEVIKVIGRGRYEKAIRDGKLRIQKDVNGAKCSRVMVHRGDFNKHFKSIIQS